MARFDFISHTEDRSDLHQRRRHHLTVENRLAKIPCRLCPRDPPLLRLRLRLIRTASGRHFFVNSQPPPLFVSLEKRRKKKNTIKSTENPFKTEKNREKQREKYTLGI